MDQYRNRLGFRAERPRNSPTEDPLILALFFDFVKKVRWEGPLGLSNTYRFTIGLFHVCALAFAAQDALRLG